MKLIIAGSRNFDLTFNELTCFIDLHQLYPTSIVSGGANGVDKSAEYYAHETGLNIDIFEADWEEHGRAAGPIRNKIMAEHGDVLLLIWDGESRGSFSMRKEMRKLNKPIYEVIIRSCK